MSALDEICDAADAAMASIGNNPNRLYELDDDALTSVATKVKLVRPILENELVARSGGLDKANAVFARIQRMAQSKLVKLVRDAQAAMKVGRDVSTKQLAALTYDAVCGCGAVMVEQERRRAMGARQMN